MIDEAPERILFSVDSEQAALGAVLLTGNQALEALAELRLRPEHFYRPSHGRIFQSMQRVYDAGGNVDKLTVREDMKRHGTDEGAIEVEALAAAPPVAGNVRDYGRRVRVLAGLRDEITAAQKLIDADRGEDSDARDRALMELMDCGDADDDSTSSAEDLADLVLEHVTSGGAGAMPLPWDAANEAMAGGFHPGCMTLLGGHSSHGKSAMADQLAQFMSDNGFDAHVYINEMTRLQRACRMAAKLSGVDGRSVLRGKLSHAEMKTLGKALSHLPFGITEAIGWTAADIARDMRRHRRQGLVVVDLLHEIDYQDEKELARNCRTLARAAKQCGCHVLATVHLSEKRVEGARRKPPTLGEIRDSGSLKNIADNVLFIWRFQDEKSGFPKPKGFLYAAKMRAGELWQLPVWFKGSTMTFEHGDHGGELSIDEEGDEF